MAAERYYGALNFGNLNAANFQRNNVFDFVHQFNSDRDAVRDELKQASTLLNQGKVLDGFSTSVKDVISFLDQTLATGKFPADEERLFSKMGFTDADRPGLLNELSIANLNGITDSDLQGPVILDRMADSFGQVDVIPLLPPDLVAGPATVPEPSSIVMLGTGTLILLGCMWYRRRWSAA